MKLSFYIDFILKLENVPTLTEQEKMGINGFDDAVLILDDIKDKSKVRDGEPCYYIAHGTEEAKERSRFLKSKALEALDSSFTRALDLLPIETNTLPLAQLHAAQL